MPPALFAAPARPPATAAARPSPADPRALLDSTLARLHSGAPAAATVDDLAEGLGLLRDTATPGAWQRTIAMVRTHPVMPLLLESPLVRRSLRKPRGYAGDATMMDMLYLGEAALENEPATPLGLEIFRRDIASPAAIAARGRLGRMAERIDAAAVARGNPHVLALGCGHLREAGLSRAVRAGRIGRFVALDQDAASLAVVQVEHAEHGIETLHRSPKATFDGTLPRAGFDLIYAVALFDDLTDRLAHTVTGACLELLRPGGRLVIANTGLDLADAGYIEACYDWVRLQRDDAAMLRLAHGLPASELLACWVSRGGDGGGAGRAGDQYLELVRRSRPA